MAEWRFSMALFDNSMVLKFFIGMSALFSSSVVLATSASVEFSAKIAYEGACEIAVPPTVIFNHGEEILPSQIEAKDAAAKKNFNLMLTNCKGVGVTPKISIVGPSNADYGDDLFLDPIGTTSIGYGILLKTEGNATFQPNVNLASNKTISTVDHWDKSTSLDTINGALAIVAILSCGRCDAKGRIGGELNATVTFDFQYD